VVVAVVTVTVGVDVEPVGELELLLPALSTITSPATTATAAIAPANANCRQEEPLCGAPDPCLDATGDAFFASGFSGAGSVDAPLADPLPRSEASASAVARPSSC